MVLYWPGLLLVLLCLAMSVPAELLPPQGHEVLPGFNAYDEAAADWVVKKYGLKLSLEENDGKLMFLC